VLLKESWKKQVFKEKEQCGSASSTEENGETTICTAFLKKNGGTKNTDKNR
jgi:hypothetical protein